MARRAVWRLIMENVLQPCISRAKRGTPAAASMAVDAVDEIALATACSLGGDRWPALVAPSLWAFQLGFFGYCYGDAVPSGFDVLGTAHPSLSAGRGKGLRTRPW